MLLKDIVARLVLTAILVPVGMGYMTINSFTASDALLVPVSTAYFALTGLVQLIETINMVKETDLNPDLQMLSVLCTFTDTTNVSRDVQALKRWWKKPLAE